MAIIGDSFKQELEMQRVAHERKIADLQSQKRLEGDDATAINAEINQQIEIANEAHALKNLQIIEKGIQSEFDAANEAHEREKIRKETIFNEQYAKLGNDEAAKLLLKDQYQEEQLQLEQEYLVRVLANLEEIKRLAILAVLIYLF